MFDRRFWTLNKLLVLALVGGFVILFLEIRSDHRDVLGDQPLSWTPIVYSGLMILLGIAGVLWYERGGRQALMGGFAIGLVVGLLGFYLHNRHHVVTHVAEVVDAWALPIEHHRKPVAYAHRSQNPSRLSSRKGGPERRTEADREGAEGRKSEPEEAPPAGPAPPARAGRKKNDLADAPPVLAPLSFAGLGLMGLLACTGAFQQARAR